MDERQKWTTGRRLGLSLGLLVVLGGVAVGVQSVAAENPSSGLGIAAGIGVAVVGAMITAVASIGPYWLEQAKARQYALVRHAGPAGPFWARDPTDFGIHRALEDVPYIPRDKQAEVARHLTEYGRVLLTGPSMAGKSRLAFEVVRDQFPRCRFVHARDGESPVELIKHGGLRDAVIWLDDLEKFTRTGLTRQDLVALARMPGIVVVATLRDNEAIHLQPTGEVKPPGADVPAWFNGHEVRIAAQWSGDELERLDAKPNVSTEVRRIARDVGLTQYLGGMPYVQDRLSKATSHISGWAVIRAVTDWRRIGFTQPIPPRPLAQLLTGYADRPLRAEEVAAGLRWATEEFAHKISLITHDHDGYATTDAVDDKLPRIPPPEQIWAIATDHGDPSQLLEVGYSAYEAQNLPVARQLWERASAAGNTTAMFNLGVLSIELDPLDLAGARGWYEKAAEGGDAGGMLNLGNLLRELDPPDSVGALSWYEKAIEAGNTSAMNNLGAILTELDPPHLAGARSWYQKAAESGDTKAMFNLGNLLRKLDPPDLAGALSWYEKGAESGETNALLQLGNCMMTELDPPDVDSALRWWGRAAAAGDTKAMVNLGVLIRQLDPPDLAGARSWYEKAAAGGDTSAMLNLGICMITEIDPPDPAQARRWYEKAAAAGDTRAFAQLGNLYAELDPPDLAQAISWFEKAADAGDTRALFELGNLYAKLDPPDHARVLSLYNAAIIVGNIQAVAYFGDLLAEIDPDHDH